jgi:hypothetical protein
MTAAAEPDAVATGAVFAGAVLCGAVFAGAGRAVHPAITHRLARTPAAGRMTFTRTRMLGQGEGHMKRGRGTRPRRAGPALARLSFAGFPFVVMV